MTKQTERKKSEIIQDFIDLLERADKQYPAAYELVNVEDKRGGDLLHRLELETMDRNELNKLTTQIRTNRRDRRYYKDIVEELEPIVYYKRDNKKSMECLKQLLGEVRKIEGYHANRTYKPRVLPNGFNSQEKR